MFGYRTLYFVGLFALMTADRILGLEHTFALPVLSIGLGSIIGSGLLAKRRHSSLWIPSYILISIIAYASWWFGSVQGQLWMGVQEDALLQWQVFFQSIGTILFIGSLIPTLALQHIFSLGEHHISEHKLKKQALLWTGTTFLLLSVFPINYIAHESNQRWDLGYFKTATPGESSVQLVENLSEPMAIYLFFQIGMDVTEEIRTYFDALPTKQLEIRYVDKDIEPQLAKELGVQSNGTIVLVQGENDERSIERINIGKKLSSAKRKLKKLDAEFREALLKLTKEPSVLYFTTGHGELYWKVLEDDDSSRNISLLKRGLGSSNFTIKELSIANGLANEVPEDATAVVILAPQMEFSKAETDTLIQFWNSGQSLFLALEPNGAALEPLLRSLNVRLDQIPLTHGSIYMPTATKALPIHKRNLITNKFSTHASVTTLSRYNKVMQLIFSDAGSLQKLDGAAKVTTIVKALEDTWQDSNNNFSQDESEKSDLFSIGMAIENSVEGQDNESKAIVFSDASWLTDDYLGKGFTVGQQTIQPHAITLSDTMSWLTDQADSTGTVNNEQDIKIQHSKEGQGWIFFCSSIFIPLLVFGLGILGIRRRKRGGQQ
jgi:hypothetical protein